MQEESSEILNSKLNTNINSDKNSNKKHFCCFLFFFSHVLTVFYASVLKHVLKHSHPASDEQ